MTWATLASSGKGKLVLFLRIGGFPYVFATEDFTPTDTWYTGEGFLDVLPYMQFRGVRLEEDASFVDGTLDVGDISIDITDVNGAVSALLKSERNRNMTRLVVSLTAGGTTAYVDGTTGFESAARIYIEGETIGVGGYTATTFTGLTRAVFGSIAKAHDVIVEPTVVQYPAVLDGVGFISGRRADIFAGTIDAPSNTLSATTCIFRGFISGDVEAGEGLWPLDLDHVSKYFSRSICTDLPKTTLSPGYYYSGETSDYYRSNIKAFVHNIGAGTCTRHDITVDAGWYDGDAALQTEINDQVTSESMYRKFDVSWNAESEKYTMFSTNSTTYRLDVFVQEGDPLFALGFTPGMYTFHNTSEDGEFEADNDYKLCLLELGPKGASNITPSIEVADSSGFEEDQYAIIKGNGYLKIQDITSNTVTFYERRFSETRVFTKSYIEIDSEEDLVLQHCFACLELDIVEVIKRFFNLSSQVTYPSRGWCVDGLSADDIDWDELDDALVGCPSSLRMCWGVFTEATQVDKIICDHLGLLGVSLRITDDAKIGFVQVRSPFASEASSVEVDSQMWDLMRANKVRTQIEGEARLNQARVKHTHNYIKQSYTHESKINYYDGIASLGSTRYKTYELPLVQALPYSAHFAATEPELLADIQPYVFGLIRMFGRLCPSVQIPTTWTAKQLKIGDIVYVTHPCLYDPTTGNIGVTDRLGIVTGKTSLVTDGNNDILTVIFPELTNTAGIAPCALGTSWVAGTLTLSFADTDLFAPSGSTDLDDFTVGDAVQFIEYDTASPATLGMTTIASIAVGSVVLSSDPFTGYGGFPSDGTLMIFRSYDNCGTDQKAWLFNGDDNYSLGSASDEAKVWSL